MPLALPLNIRYNRYLEETVILFPTIGTVRIPGSAVSNNNSVIFGVKCKTVAQTTYVTPLCGIPFNLKREFTPHPLTEHEGYPTWDFEQQNPAVTKFLPALFSLLGKALSSDKSPSMSSFGGKLTSIGNQLADHTLQPYYFARISTKTLDHLSRVSLEFPVPVSDLTKHAMISSSLEFLNNGVPIVNVGSAFRSSFPILDSRPMPAAKFSPAALGPHTYSPVSPSFSLTPLSSEEFV